MRRNKLSFAKWYQRLKWTSRKPTCKLSSQLSRVQRTRLRLQGMPLQMKWWCHREDKKCSFRTVMKMAGYISQLIVRKTALSLNRLSRTLKCLKHLWLHINAWLMASAPVILNSHRRSLSHLSLPSLNSSRFSWDHRDVETFMNNHTTRRRS